MKKIIIIDDSESIRKVLSSKSTLEGYMVDTASDGEKGLKMLRQADYSAALLGHDMPKLNGLELYMELRKEGLSIKDRIIFYTGSDCSYLHNYLERRKIPYLIKPASLNKIEEYISAFCDKYS